MAFGLLCDGVRSMAGLIPRIAGLVAMSLALANFASAAETPAPAEDGQLKAWFREVRADIGSARSAIENRVLNAEARQAERIGEVHERVDALEGVPGDTHPGSGMQPLDITWNIIVVASSLIGVALGVLIASRRDTAVREKELSIQPIEWETRKLEAQLQERQLRTHEKEQRWTRISFLFAQAQRLLEDRELSHILDILERPSRHAPLRNMLRKLGTAGLNDEEARLLRALNRLLDRLELVAMAWNDELFTLQEIGAFLRHVASLTGRAALPELTSYCAQHYQLTHRLAKACEEFEVQANRLAFD
jgi:hypothetical protein